MFNSKINCCDDCGCRALGTEVLAPIVDNDLSPILFICKDCDPRLFERVARRDIDSWLVGEVLF